MSERSERQRDRPAAARVFGDLQADDALLPGEASALRRSGALFLALLVLGAVAALLRRQRRRPDRRRAGGARQERQQRPRRRR